MTFKTIALPEANLHYTLPGYQPELTAMDEDTYAEEYELRNRIPVLSDPAPATWRQVLVLDQAPVDPYICAPPPTTFPQARDVAAERRHWRRILSTREDSEEVASVPEAVRQMLNLLQQYQRHEAMLLSYGLAQGAA